MSSFQVFNHSGEDRSSLTRVGQAVFLDDFRIMLAYRNSSPINPELVVFNTLVPQDHPRNVRRFRLPQKYRDWRAYVRLDHYRPLGAVNRDGPLITDPTQSIFIMELSSNPPQPTASLVLRMQPLIELACSMRTDVQIPWDEWGRGPVVMEIPKTPFCHIYLTAVHGAHLLVIHGTDRADERRNIHLLDFGRGGSTVLPLSDENDGEIERRALFKHGRSSTLKWADGVIPWVLQPIGDSVVAIEPRVVNLLSYSTVQDAVD